LRDELATGLRKDDLIQHARTLSHTLALYFTLPGLGDVLDGFARRYAGDTEQRRITQGHFLRIQHPPSLTNCEHTSLQSQCFTYSVKAKQGCILRKVCLHTFLNNRVCTVIRRLSVKSPTYSLHPGVGFPLLLTTYSEGKTVSFISITSKEIYIVNVRLTSAIAALPSSRRQCNHAKLNFIRRGSRSLLSFPPVLRDVHLTAGRAQSSSSVALRA
jgi:hypothetical protein